MKLFLFNRNVAIDMGTSNTLIWTRKKGIALREPSVLAIDIRTNNIHDFGTRAYSMRGKTPGDLRTVFPVQNGVIAHFDYTRQMLQHYMSRAVKKLPLMRLKAVITVPVGASQVDQQSVITACKRIGIKELFLIKEPLAAALGAGLPVDEARGNLIINFGGGVTEVASVSLGGIVKYVSLPHGGDALDAAIQRYIFRNYQIAIGLISAQKAKEQAGYAIDPPDAVYDIKGINRRTQKPVQAGIPMAEITKAIFPVLQTVVNASRSILSQIPPQLISDVLKYGVVLVGGGAMLKNLETWLSRELNVPVFRAEDPFTCAALGAGMVFGDFKKIQLLELVRV